MGDAEPPAPAANGSPSRAASNRSLAGRSKAGSRVSLGSQVLKKSAKSSSKGSLGNVAADAVTPAVEGGGEAVEQSAAVAGIEAPPENEGEEASTAAVTELPPEGETRTQSANIAEDGSVSKPAEGETADPVEPQQPVEGAPQEAPEGSGEPGTVEEVAENPEGEESQDIELSRLEAMEHSMEQMISDAQEDFQEIGEEIEVIPAVGRILTSPPPADIEGFTFMNINYEEDPDIPVMYIGTRLSRSESVMSGAEGPETRATSASTRVRTPLLRASTPTLAETKREEGMSAEEQRAELDAAVCTTDVTAAMLEEGVDREALILGIRLALDLREKYRAKNTFLQNKLGEYFRRKRADENHDGEKSVTDQEQRYANCMSALQDLRSEFESLNSTNQKVVNEYKLRLEERILEAESKATEFVKYKRNIALGAENSRTGKPLPTKVVDQLEATELKKEADVVAVRLENIKLRNKLRRHEQLLRQKEELADGLHLIDFEQLKIENQTYNEKIEERNEELLKLRKKITNIVQVLTHVKEKLQFVQGENVDLKRRLRQLDDEVSSKRDSLPLAKQSRDALRSNSLALRQKNGLLGNTSLLRDFEEKVVRISYFSLSSNLVMRAGCCKENFNDESLGLKTRIDELRACHADLCADTLAIKRRIHRKMLV
ncbi:Coiled-coil domain-containing protein 96 [Dinochytrium kinnereticum]|nr:Coiled-coil domain-containing protein 96 [Dinochytrium kinnereticum]